jgi:F-type H+-transporting ATPase subunit delta
MSDLKIANRYAQALIQQAISDKKLEVVAKNMQVFFDTYHSSKDLRNVLSNPVINNSQKLSALNTIFKDFDKLSANLIRLVCKKNREGMLSEIADTFIAAYRTHMGVQKVNVESAVKADEKTLQSIKKYVMDRTGAKDIELHTSINPEVIGGLVIKFGDNLLDTSIAAKLRNLKKELNIA